MRSSGPALTTATPQMKSGAAPLLSFPFLTSQSSDCGNESRMGRVQTQPCWNLGISIADLKTSVYYCFIFSCACLGFSVKFSLQVNLEFS